MKEKRIGFVGLGRMGSNMARCLKEKGYQVTALYDRKPDTAKDLAIEIDSAAYTKLAEVTAHSEIIFTVVTDDAAMRSIFTGDNSLLKKATGKTFINCATLTPGIHIEVSEIAAAAGAEALEACMASSIPQAREGKLFLMIGGNENTFHSLTPLFDDLSEALHYIGPIGKASQVKALVNMVMNINTAALAEGLGMGDALGLDLEMLCQVFSQTGADSRVLETDAADMINRDHECYFSAEHAAKDSGIALALAREAGIETPLAQATLEQYNKLVNAGKGQLDKSGVAELTFKGRENAS
ncbi:MAG: NAD(P)-dependent oxidoreductase [Verrucomicrobiota bacterium]